MTGKTSEQRAGIDNSVLLEASHIADKQWIAEAARIDDIVPDPYRDVDAPLSASENPLGYVRAQTARHRLLKAHEEVELSKAIEAGLFAAERRQTLSDDHPDAVLLDAVVARGTAAHEYMIGANLRMVQSIALRYRSFAKSLQIEDLVQAGIEGLDWAIKSFDYTRGYKFSVLATQRIKSTVRKRIIDEDRAIRLPRDVLETLSTARNITPEQYTYQQREATDTAARTEVLSLQMPMGDTLTLEDIVDSNCAEPAVRTNAALEEYIEENVDGLNAEELRILKDYVHSTAEGYQVVYPSVRIQHRGWDVMGYVRAKLSHPSNPLLEEHLLETQPWREKAACRDTRLHDAFVSRTDRIERGIKLRDLRALCGACVVAAECADFAVQQKQRFGIWGGLSRAQRKDLSA